MSKVLQEKSASAAGADTRFTTISGRRIAPLYGPADTEQVDYARDLADPGQYPYTRGIHESVPGEGLDDAAVRGLRQRGPDGETPASSTCSSTAAAGCRSRSTCRP